MILLGVDGGGTKTEWLVSDGAGCILSRLVTDGCNYYSIQLQGIRDLFTQAMDTLLSPLSLACADVSLAVVGMPVVEENPRVEQAVAGFLRELFPERATLCNDAVVGLAGSLGGAPGISVICGTGSICAGSDGRRYVRCGGWSGQFCDEASCHWIGRRALELFTKQADGRMPKSPLYALFRESFGLERDLDTTYHINHNLNQSRAKMAALQLLVAQAMRAGDSHAASLYGQAAQEIALMVQTVRGWLSLPDPVRVSYAGGLFRTAGVLALVEAALGNAYALQPPAYTPAQGALLLVARQRLPEGALPAFLEHLQREPAPD